MVFDVGNKSLNQVREVIYNEINEVYVCEDTKSKHKDYYTLWKVKDHQLAKELLKVLNQSKEKSICGEYFSGKNFMGFLFPYEKERPLFRFYAGKARSIKEREEIHIELVKACMIYEMPYSLLYLLLSQKQIQLQRDNSIYFSYFVDLKEFDRNTREEDCVNLCAKLLLDLMEEESVKGVLSYSLLTHKVEKKSYLELNQLYKDLKVSSYQRGKHHLLRRIVNKVYLGKDAIFRALLVCSCILVGFAFMIIISQIIFGEIPLFRIFQNCFSKIGTESLLQ